MTRILCSSDCPCLCPPIRGCYFSASAVTAAEFIFLGGQLLSSSRTTDGLGRTLKVYLKAIKPIWVLHRFTNTDDSRSGRMVFFSSPIMPRSRKSCDQCTCLLKYVKIVKA